MDPNRIPLYLAAGPGLTLHSEDGQSNDWFRNVFVDESVLPEHADDQDESLKWYRNGQHQSRIGVLVRVPPPAPKDGEEGKTPRITELLFYASTSALDVAGRPLTSPVSSAAENEHAPKAARQSHKHYRSLQTCSTPLRSIQAFLWPQGRPGSSPDRALPMNNRQSAKGTAI